MNNVVVLELNIIMWTIQFYENNQRSLEVFEIYVQKKKRKVERFNKKVQYHSVLFFFKKI